MHDYEHFRLLPSGIYSFIDGKKLYSFEELKKQNIVTIKKEGIDAFHLKEDLEYVLILDEEVSYIFDNPSIDFNQMRGLVLSSNFYRFLDPLQTFQKLKNLEFIFVKEGNIFLKDDHNCLVSKDCKTLIFVGNHAEIPNSITSIDPSAFAGNKDIQTFIIPNSVTYLEDYAFIGSSINKITIPNSIIHMGKYCFDSTLKEVYIEEEVSEIDFQTFRFLEIEKIVFKNPNGWKIYFNKRTYYDNSHYSQSTGGYYGVLSTHEELKGAIPLNFTQDGLANANILKEFAKEQKKPNPTIIYTYISRN